MDARDQIERSFTEKYSPRMTAASFALGAFIVLMPTSGTGLLIFGGIALLFSQVNEIALFSTALVFNPAVKIVFYGLSYVAGGLALGQSISLTGLTLQQLMAVSSSMLLGSFIVATSTALLSFFTVYRVASIYGR